VASVLTVAASAAGAAGARGTGMPDIRAFSPEADTYVSEAAPDANFGHSLMLRACGSPQTTTYLRFRLKKLPKDVTSMILLLHTRAGARTSYEIRRAERVDWREERLTYANAPRLSMRYAAAKMVRHGAWSAVDVTKIVGGRIRVTLAITTRSRAGVAFDSRESKLGPRLVVRSGDGMLNLGTLLP
jgi:hypothetical protein